MRPVLLIDFGSTYTKLTAVDLDGAALLGTAAAYTTVQTDISDGLREGLARLEERTGKLDYLQTYACSSAAGGLRMIASGLVPELTSEAAKLVHVCPNVMPKFGVLQIEPTQSKIREIFLNRIVQAKGLSQVTDLLSGILMPTPSAVLQAMELLAKGCEGELGIGDLVAVDVGGATTDVYSMADGMPEQMNTVYKGLPEPFSKRTVEGDIGMRYSIRGIVEAAGLPRVSQLSGLSQDRVEALVDMLRANTDRLPNGDRELENLDYALASLAMEETYTLMGQTFVQSGKNLTNVRQIVVTGGSLIHAERVAEIARHALYSTAQPASLRPKEADIWVDRTYILAAMGLLAAHEPQTALRIMKKELEKHGYQK